MDAHAKRVDECELLFTLLASELDIAPRLLRWKRRPDGSFTIEVELFPFTLFNVPYRERRKYREKIKDRIRALHRAGIYHGDMHDENIVISKEGDVALIDYGESMWIDEITKDDLSNNMYTTGDEGIFHPSSVGELLEKEIQEVDMFT